MIKKNICLVITCILALTFVGCGKPENENNPLKEDVKVTEKIEEEEDNKEDVTQESLVEEESAETTNKDESVETPSNKATQPSAGTTQPSKESNSTTQPSMGTNNTSNSGGTNNSGPSNTGNIGSTNTETKPSEPVHEHSWEPIKEEKTVYYAWRTICNVCKLDMTDMTGIDIVYHVSAVCGGSYAAYYKEVDFVTDDTRTRVTIVGYKCECGATKEGTGESWIEAR